MQWYLIISRKGKKWTLLQSLSDAKENFTFYKNEVYCKIYDLQDGGK